MDEGGDTARSAARDVIEALRAGPKRATEIAQATGILSAPLCAGALIGASPPTGERREDPAGPRGVGAAKS
jgi:hypothetical protein